VAIVPDLVRAGYPLEVAQWMARQAIFALDVYQVLVSCEGTVVNLNGRVPDEGAAVEGAMVWTAGKAVVLFKDDARSKIDGLDNHLVAGLGGFRLVSTSEELPRHLPAPWWNIHQSNSRLDRCRRPHVRWPTAVSVSSRAMGQEMQGG
jgi:hypothetical protein